MLETTQTAVMVGTLAPDFDLPCTSVDGSDRRAVQLADYRGNWLVLMFYPRDFSMVCPTELTALSNRLDELHEHGAEVLGISTDTLESHERWVATPPAQGGLGGLRYPLASDEDGSVSTAYGVYLERQRVALRGLFVVDPNGVLQYQVVHNLSVGRRTDDLLRVLAALQSGGLCAEGWTPADPHPDPANLIGPGTIVSHYRVEQRVGSGSFATVFRALDTKLQRTVALKTIKPGTAVAPSSMLAEARATAALNHPNICTIFEVDDSPGVELIAMEFLSGRTLDEVIEPKGLAPKNVTQIGRQIAAGMAAAHDQGIVHGDLKPANVMVSDDGVAKILDFGLSRRTDSLPAAQETLVTGIADAVEEGNLVGTPNYMSPEQALGQSATAASDVFALGLLFYEMLTGRKVFPGENVLEVIGRVQHVDPVPFASELPDPFAQIVRHAMIRDPQERRITMQQILDTMGASVQAP